MKSIVLCIAGMVMLCGVAFGAGKTAELNIFIDQPQFQTIYQKYFDLFSAQYLKETGTTVKINYESVAPDNSEQVLQTRFASGNAPDIFKTHPGNNAPAYEKAGYLDDLDSQPFVKNLYPGVRSIVTYDGKVKCLPLESSFWGYLYNKEAFSKAGIKNPPMTLSEMKADVDKLKKAGITPFLLSYKEDWVPQLFNSLLVGSFNVGIHKGFVDRMNQGKTSFAELKEYFDIIDLVNANGNADAMNITAEQGSADFGSGTYAMWVQGPWQSEEILKAHPDMSNKLAVAALPLTDSPKDTMVNVSVSSGLFVYSGSKNKEVAYALLNFLLSKGIADSAYQELAFMPLSTTQTFKPFPWMVDALSLVQQGKGYQDPQMPQAVKDEVGRQLQLYFLKQATKNQVITALDQKWKDAVNATK